MSKILKVENLSKTYRSGEHDLNVLNNVSFDVDKGQSFAIVGPSGSGKTTLLGLCAGLDTTDEGEIWLCGENLLGLDEDGRAFLRNQNVGFVFQDFQLLPTFRLGKCDSSVGTPRSKICCRARKGTLGKSRFVEQGRALSIATIRWGTAARSLGPCVLQQAIHSFCR